IAVLIGEIPANFTLSPCNTIYPVAYIPIEIPSALLERRPDIAQAERQVAKANAQIGAAIAAYFPVLTLNGEYGYDTNQFLKLFSGPASLWSMGAQLAQTIFDGGARKANVQIATANYDATVANYRQVVLAAFQNVEDNLATLRILNQELVVQEASLKTAEQALNIITNEYKAGTAALANVLNAEITTFNAKKGVNDVTYRRFYAAVGLINALGGDYSTEED
ncbi:MAG TPA: efflux transporter outer membrane subunit, partial [Candidatus Berkiella sp.]|nr:efflux transporter outer membrane subunit [Candidatus Berkiella sp.]